MSAHADSAVASVSAGPYTVRGISVGGVYTSLQVPELSAVLDLGLPIRAFCAGDNLFLSHGHADHIGGLIGLLGVRGMMQKAAPPRLFAPAEIQADVEEMLRVASRLQRYPLDVQYVALNPGDEASVGPGLSVRAFRTHHPVPSLGYQFFRRVKKMLPAYVGLSGPEIKALKEQGEAMFADADHLELAYATDTLVRVLETNPSMLKSRVLVLECTFFDERKSLKDSRAGCHIHLDELLGVAHQFENEHLVLMHVSQIYRPRDAREILEKRWPKGLATRVSLLAPERGAYL